MQRQHQQRQRQLVAALQAAGRRALQALLAKRLEAPAHQRLGGSIMLGTKALEAGVQLLRVHDVPETVQALRVWREGLLLSNDNETLQGTLKRLQVKP